jgi:hypothetical protein
MARWVRDERKNRIANKFNFFIKMSTPMVEMLQKEL